MRVSILALTQEIRPQSHFPEPEAENMSPDHMDANIQIYHRAQHPTSTSSHVGGWAALTPRPRPVGASRSLVTKERELIQIKVIQLKTFLIKLIQIKINSTNNDSDENESYKNDLAQKNSDENESYKIDSDKSDSDFKKWFNE